MSRLSRKSKWLLGLGLLVLGAMIAVRFLTGTEPVDTRFTGAFELEDGRLVFVAPREGKSLRYRMMNGDSQALWPTSGLGFEAGPGWSEKEPVQLAVEFQQAESDVAPGGLVWEPTDGQSLAGSKLDLPEVFTAFPSGDMTLRGKLVLPTGEPPFPAVVLVHGSERYSAVDNYYLPYLFASQGIATLAFDKRGTGESTGKYTQNFYVLSDDVVAAVEWLRGRGEIDGSNIHLAGYSQGGWIAPLAATKTANIRSLLIAYGPMVPITGEDRWGYVWALQEKGFGDEAIAKADEINDVVGAIMDDGEDRWSELRQKLKDARGQDWFEAVAGSDGVVGFLAGTRMPLWVIRIVAWWVTRGEIPFVDRKYDPVPTLTSLDMPSLWIFGGRDSSMPTDWSIVELERLQTAGKPIEIELYPRAEHGILLMEETESGNPRPIGYAPGYFKTQVEWLRSQSGLPPLESVAVSFSATGW